jgi:hypothetical protein
MHCEAEFTAAFLLTIHVSYQEPAHRERDVGPFCREFGAEVAKVYVVEDECLAALRGAHPVDPVLLLGADALKCKALESVFGMALRAGFDRSSSNYLALWSHPQLQRKEVGSGGSYYTEVLQRPEFSVEVPHDVPPADISEDIAALKPLRSNFWQGRSS